MLADDDAIEHGEKLFELSPEKEKISKQCRQAERERQPDKPAQKRERKPDADKQTIIDAIYTGLCDNLGGFAENGNIENPERTITFVYNSSNYTITLTKHRPPKK